MKNRPPARPTHRPSVKTSGVLAKMLKQQPTTTMDTSSQALATAQTLLDDVMQSYNQADWDEAEKKVDIYLSNARLPPLYRIPGLNLKATLAARTHRMELAVQMWQEILTQKPDYVDALSNLGLALQKLHRPEEALHYLEEGLRYNPHHANGHVNIGLLYANLHRHEEALQSYNRALAIDPMQVQAQFNIAKMLQDEFNFDAAREAYLKALTINPLHADSQANLIFMQHYRYPLDLPLQLEAAKRYSSLFPIVAPPAKSDPNKAPLRVGWVSADFGQHPVGFFLRQVMQALSETVIARRNMEFIAYSNSPRVDELTRDLQRAFATWHTVDIWSDARLEAQIRSDQIDILIDLSGHTAGNRLPVFATKPAPVQISWLGYFATTGMPAMDAILADPICVPTEEASLYSEQIVRLPRTRLCFSAPHDVAMPARPAVSQNGYITFGCFQNLPKINDAVLSRWSQILAACPNAKLRVQTELLGKENYRALFENRLRTAGIDLSRVMLRGRVERDVYFQCYNEVDILLDTFPYPGGTTTAEALWMGTPTLTLALPGMLGRQGQAMLENVGLQDWVCTSEDDYVKKAIDWGQAQSNQIQTLARLRDQLRDTCAQSPLFDAARFARDWVQALQGLWREKMRSPS